MLIDDNVWWSPDFLRFLGDLRNSEKTRRKAAPEETVSRLRIPLLNKLAELDPTLIELKGEFWCMG
jgi:hypothetical protein